MNETQINDRQTVVRFAPSPTGYLHIGGARTAVFNWLYARKTGGKLILRIEDTDVERSTEASIQGILDGLQWLGIAWDEGPYFQTDFLQDHLDAANRLLASGRAYKCFCTKEELEERREKARLQKAALKYDGTCRRLSPEAVAEKEAAGLPHTIRLKVPEGPGSVRFHDKVYGYIEKRTEDIEDFVIVRSNGLPLYVLSNVVDDIRDGITHVIRGQDGLANTPKQILIYEALEVPIPEFAHMPLTLDPKKAKISKRKHGEKVAIRYYREHGFLPWAFVNFLVLLGWATTDSREFFAPEELIEAFSLEGIKRSNAVFDIRQDDPKFFTDPKAISMNAHYLRTLPLDEILPYVRAELERAGLWDPEFEGGRREWFRNTVDLIRTRFHVTTEFATLGRPYFSDDFEFDPKAVKKNIRKHEGLRDWFPLLAERLEALSPFTCETVEWAIRETSEALGVKAGILINAIRTAVTGQAAGPGLFEILEAVGQERVVKRIRDATGLLEPADNEGH